MVLCLVISCGNKTGKKRSNVEKVRFSRVLRVVVNQGQSTPKNLLLSEEECGSLR